VTRPEIDRRTQVCGTRFTQVSRKCHAIVASQESADASRLR